MSGSLQRAPDDRQWFSAPPTADNDDDNSHAVGIRHNSSGGGGGGAGSRRVFPVRSSESCEADNCCRRRPCGDNERRCVVCELRPACDASRVAAVVVVVVVVVVSSTKHQPPPSSLINHRPPLSPALLPASAMMALDALPPDCRRRPFAPRPAADLYDPPSSNYKLQNSDI